MSFEITNHSEQALIEIRFFGSIGFDSWIQAHAAMLKLDNGHALKQVRIILTDLSEASLVEFTNADISHRSVDLLRQSMTFNPAITVIVIAPASFEFGLMRMLQGNVEGMSSWKSYIVRTRDEAMTLLNTLKD